MISPGISLISLYDSLSPQALAALSNPKALSALKYLLLCKTMAGHAGEVPGLIAAKGGLKWTGPEIEAMRKVAKASHDRSLDAFMAARDEYRKELAADSLVANQLEILYNTLLEANLLKVMHTPTPQA